MYYFEQTNSLLSDLQVETQLGCAIHSLDGCRKCEIGLYPAYFDDTLKYNRYSHTVSGFTWVRFETPEHLFAVDSETGIRFNNTVFAEQRPRTPFYIQRWNVVELTGAMAEQGIFDAKLKVAQEAARLLATVSVYINQNGCPDEITTYAKQLLDLSASPAYPFTLAADVGISGQTSWPTYPDLTTVLESITDAVATTTNADIAFTRILNTYSIPGTYPQKVTAITNAVAVYGVDGSITSIFNHAVGELTAA